MAWFNLIGNKWFDNHIKNFYSFTQELNSAACHTSPLTEKDVESLRKCMERVAKISETISKRVNKKKK